MGVNSPVFFVHGLVAHHVGILHLSTENIEFQIEILGVRDEAAAALQAGVPHRLTADPDLVPPAVELQVNLERARQIGNPSFDVALRTDAGYVGLVFVLVGTRAGAPGPRRQGPGEAANEPLPQRRT